MNQQPKQKFSLLTTIALIIGIVIGSGIFFRVPIIIRTLEGNLGAGILVFLIASIGIIFGGLTIARFAKETARDGGIITYCEISWGKTLGYVAGWFQTVLYFPAICAIIVWVGANYTCALFGWNNLLIDGTFGIEVWIICIVYTLFFFTLNIFSKRNAGKFQNISMFVKIAALLLLGIAGFIFGNPQDIVSETLNRPFEVKSLFMGVVIVAYAFDGWLIAPLIAHEIKDSKRNLPIALTLAPLAITAIYLLYFLGASIFVGVDQILAGIDPIKYMSESLFGNVGFKIILFLIIISVLGAFNGVVLSYMRLPYSLASRNELPGSKYLKTIHPKYDIPLQSSFLSLIMLFVWLFLHFLSVDGVALYNLTLLDGLAVDNLPIVLNHIFYILLYIGAIIKVKDSTKSWSYNYLIPFFAIIGASFILYGGFTEEKFNIYLIISLAVIAIGLLVRPKESKD